MFLVLCLFEFNSLSDNNHASPSRAFELARSEAASRNLRQLRKFSNYENTLFKMTSLLLCWSFVWSNFIKLFPIFALDRLLKAEK